MCACACCMRRPGCPRAGCGELRLRHAALTTRSDGAATGRSSPVSESPVAAPEKQAIRPALCSTRAVIGGVAVSTAGAAMHNATHATLVAVALNSITALAQTSRRRRAAKLLPSRALPPRVATRPAAPSPSSWTPLTARTRGCGWLRPAIRSSPSGSMGAQSPASLNNCEDTHRGQHPGADAASGL
jgi:hypothetical protein